MRRSALRFVGIIAVAASVTLVFGHSRAVEPEPFDSSRSLRRVTSLSPRIVNGVAGTGAFPAVALLGGPFGAACSGTLIGCNTVLTAAHCFNDSLDPASYAVFLQHAGFFALSSIARHPAFVPGDEFSPGDIAVVKLAPQVTGIRPARINTMAKPEIGLPGTIVGYGGTGGPANPGVGLLRAGSVTTASCSPVSNATHLCWDFQAPIGPPGSDSGTCVGDSGGPLLLDSAAGPVVAGVTSAGTEGCLAPSHTVDVDVYVNRSWIQSVAGPDIDSATCGAVPQVFDADTAIYTADSSLEPGETSEQRSVVVPAGASSLRVAVNSDLTDLGRNFDLHVRRSTPPTTSAFDCRSVRLGPTEYCEIPNPEAGTWWVLVSRTAGQGDYQLTVTVLGGEVAAPSCVPDGSTLCIDDLPGDRRFSAQVFFHTTQGGMPTGFAVPVPLADKGVAAGGLFWFTNPTNPEMLLKVLKGCDSNQHFWVFYAAGTNFGLTTTVTDTKTGRTWSRDNPDRELAAPVADRFAFPCE